MIDNQRIYILEKIVRIQNYLLSNLIYEHVNLDGGGDAMYAEDYLESINELNNLLDKLNKIENG